MDRYTVGDTVDLYEINFRRLMRLFPRLREVDASATVTVNQLNEIRVDVVERCPYTMVVDLRHDFASANKWLNAPSMRLRLCYDAEVVEVIAYQGQQRFLSRYAYPNERMFARHEKRMLNLFLAEWLDHCLAGQRRPFGLHELVRPN